MSVPSISRPTCSHDPLCPAAEATDREAAHTVASHPDQGWSLLCNGVLLFEDTGEILPGGRIIAPHRCTSGGHTSRGAAGLVRLVAVGPGPP